MGLDAIVTAVIMGIGVGVSGALGMVCLWLGARAWGFLALGVGVLLADLALIAYLLWSIPAEGWKLSLFGVIVGVTVVGGIALSRQEEM
jgi:hypothetical protein